MATPLQQQLRQRARTAQMCVGLEFRCGRPLKPRTQERPNIPIRIVLRVKDQPAPLCVIESVPWRPQPCMDSRIPSGSYRVLQAILVTLLAWVALLCVGLGGTVGVVSHTLIGKLAASVQHLQRQGGTSLSSRVLRREFPVAAELNTSEASAASAEVRVDSGVLAGRDALPVNQRHTEASAFTATEPRLCVRHGLPPSRAPPVLA